MRAISKYTVIAALLLAVLSFFLDRMGAVGLYLLGSAIALLVSINVYGRLAKEEAKLAVAGVGFVPVTVVMVLFGGDLWAGARDAMTTATDDATVVVAPSVTPSPAASTAPQGNQEPETQPKITITSPDSFARVSIEGVVVRGTAQDVPGDLTLWLLLKSPDDGGRHYVSGSFTPVEGRWTLGTGQIGSDDPVEIGQTYVIEVVAASGEAERAIRDTFEEGGDAYFSKLPAGAEILASRPVERK